MADFQCKIAPFIDILFYVTQIFWNNNSHKGIDLATSRIDGNVELYSMCNGIVIEKGYQENGWGYYIIMRDSKTDLGFLYAHMSKESQLNVNDNVKIGQFVGFEGTSGNSTGIHLHLEMQYIKNNKWTISSNKDDYVDPSEFLGIPNEKGITAIYINDNILKNNKFKKYLMTKSKKINIKC